MGAKRLFKFGLMIVAAAISKPGFAAGDKSYVSIALSRVEVEAEADVVKSKSAVTIMNVSGGWVQGGGLTLGLKYLNINQSGDGAQDGGVTTSGYGPMIGFYHASGFFSNVAYLYKPTKKYLAGNTHFEFNGGDGYVLDLGKVFEMGSWGAAFEISYSKVFYKNMYDGSDHALSGTWYDAGTYPYVAVFVYL